MGMSCFFNARKEINESRKQSVINPRLLKVKHTDSIKASAGVYVTEQTVPDVGAHCF